MAKAPPKYANNLSEFVGDLRSRLFASQQEAANYFQVARPTITRYESGTHNPPLGYLACLVRLLVDRQEETEAVTYQTALMREVNRAIRDYYEPRESPFAEWHELCQVAEEYQTRQQSRYEASVSEPLKPDTSSAIVKNEQQNPTNASISEDMSQTSDPETSQVFPDPVRMGETSEFLPKFEMHSPLVPSLKKTRLPIWAIVIIGVAAILVIGLVMGIIFVPGQTVGQLSATLTRVMSEVAVKLEKTAKSEIPPATATPVPLTATPTPLPPTATSTLTPIPPTVTPTPPNTPTNPPTSSPPTSLSAPVEASGELLAVIIGFEPVVEVKRGGTNFLIPAAFAMPLFRGDVVNTYRGATAKIICENGQIYELPPEKNLTVYCQDTPDTRNLDQVPPELGEPLVNPAEPLTPTLTFTQTRAARVAWQKLPLLLIPRNTVITDTRPTFSWQPVAGASGYRLTLNSILGGGETWSQDTSATYLPYPAGVSPLAPDSINSVILVRLDDETAADTTLLRVMDEAGQAELAKAEADIRALALDEAAQDYLLAQLYRQREMRAAVIAQLKALTPTLPEEGSAYLWQQLGDLYFESGLYAQAEENYQTALSAAEAAADPGAQAAAHAGLARVVYILEETGPAIEHLTSAENLYKAAGDRKRAEIVAAERAKLEE